MAKIPRLGTKVRYVPRDNLHEMFHCMPLTDEARNRRRRRKTEKGR
ncbi:MAG: hypothetical protein ACYTG0_15620 [Planctomycetota bacterium]|jgi:hypothetical protein